MNKLSKTLLLILFSWATVFTVSFFVSENISFKERVLYSGVMGLFAAIIFFLPTTTKTTASNKSKNIYIFEGKFGNKPVYRICNNKVYIGSSNKYRYEIKGDKIYPPLSSKPLFQIKGNRIYKVLDPKVAYRIDGNKVYKGELGNIPIYRICNSSNGR